MSPLFYVCHNVKVYIFCVMHKIMHSDESGWKIGFLKRNKNVYFERKSTEIVCFQQKIIYIL